MGSTDFDVWIAADGIFFYGHFAWCSFTFLVFAVLWRRWSIRWWIESRLSRKTKAWLSLFFMVSMMSADDLFRRIDSLSQAATAAAQAAVTVLNHLDQGSPRSGGGDQVLKQPDAFEADDPIEFSTWRLQFMNWLTWLLLPSPGDRP